MVSSGAFPLSDCELLKGKNHVLFMIIFRTSHGAMAEYSPYLNNSTKIISY
jgi:hypothetical protein